MKLLLCITSLSDIEPYLQQQGITLQQHATLKFLSSAKIMQHDVDVLVTGVGVYQTTYKLTKALTAQKYHLALKLGFGNSYKEELPVGMVLNIINEKPGDYGMIQDGEWKDHYDYNLLNREDEPHVRGGFVNLTNAYMNIFTPIKKVVGITVNNYADTGQIAQRCEKYKVDCETGDGLGFVYPCLFEKQSFYHLCFIERCLVNGQADFDLAKRILNETLVNLMNVI